MIHKELKYVSFHWSPDSRVLSIHPEDEGSPDLREGVVLRRNEMFSLMRFIIRIAQRGKPRK